MQPDANAGKTLRAIWFIGQFHGVIKAQRIARQLRSGMVEINGVGFADGSPFGGYKQSGNGREGGKWGLEEFLEVKSISGWK